MNLSSVMPECIRKVTWTTSLSLHPLKHNSTHTPLSSETHHYVFVCVCVCVCVCSVSAGITFSRAESVEFICSLPEHLHLGRGRLGEGFRAAPLWESRHTGNLL